MRFAGEYRDTESGLVYLRARYYDPTTGQFLTRDPIESVTREPYAYVGNNPLNGVDPTGLYWGEGLVEDAWDASYEWSKDHLDEVSTVANGISMVSYATCGITGGIGCGVGGILKGVSAGAQVLHTVMNCIPSDRGSTCATSAVSSVIAVGGVLAPPLLAGRLVLAFNPTVAKALSNYMYDLMVWTPSLSWNSPELYEC